VYVPLDPSYPEERLRFMARNAELKAILTQPHLMELVQEDSVEIVEINSEAILLESEQNPGYFLSGDNLAYIIFTSGSTGVPKAIAITHKAAANHFTAVRKVLELDEDDRVLQFASLNFDVSLEQIISTLLSGALVVMRGPEVWSPVEFRDKVCEFGLTVADL